MKRLAIAGAILLVFVTAGWYGLHFVPADFIYGVEAEFQDLPQDDTALEGWLQQQPSVWRAHVERQPSKTRCRLVVTLGMTRDG
jgi:hypothetical protein